MTGRNLRSPFKAWLFSGATLCGVDLATEGDDGTGGEAAEVSLRDELANALSAATEADAGSTGQVQAAASPAALAAPKPATPAAVRDETGKFAKAPEQAQTPIKTEPKTPQASAEPSAVPGAEASQQQRTSAPPPSLKATAKAEWDKFPPAAREELWRLEDGVQQAKAEWAQKAERFNRLDSVLAPRRERFQLAGIDEAQGVQALLAAQDYLERDPVNGIAYLARQYGVDLRAFAQSMPGQQAQQARLPPQVLQLAEEVQTLKNALAQQQSSSQQATRSEYLNQVQQFASDPSNIYFENVRERMGALLRSGQAKNLAEAYEQATWADSDVRPLLMRKQQEEQQAQAQEAARAKATQARHASGSVIGSPSPGSTPGRGSSNATLRDDLQAAWNEHAA